MGKGGTPRTQQIDAGACSNALSGSTKLGLRSLCLLADGWVGDSSKAPYFGIIRANGDGRILRVLELFLGL